MTRVEVREAVGIALMLNLAVSGDEQDKAAKALVALSDLEDTQVDQLAQALYLLLDPGGDERKRAEIASAFLQPLTRSGWELPD